MKENYCIYLHEYNHPGPIVNEFGEVIWFENYNSALEFMSENGYLSRRHVEIISSEKHENKLLSIKESQQERGLTREDAEKFFRYRITYGNLLTTREKYEIMLEFSPDKELSNYIFNHFKNNKDKETI